MALQLNANQTWEQLAKETKDEMLESFWEHGLHLIPCGSKQDFIPEYFRSKHPFETEEEVKMRWSKTPRVKWSDYQALTGRRLRALTSWFWTPTHRKLLISLKKVTPPVLPSNNPLRVVVSTIFIPSTPTSKYVTVLDTIS